MKKGIVGILICAIVLVGIFAAFSSGTTKALEAPATVSAVNGDGCILITWSMVKKASSYAVLKKDGDGNWLRIGVVKNNVFSYTDNEVKNGKEYSYSVRALNKKSAEGEPGTVKYTYLAAPKIKSVKSSGGGIKVTWAKSKFAKSYTVFKRTSSGESWNEIKTVAGSKSSFIDKDVKLGDNYCYTVSQSKAKAVSLFDDNGKSATYLGQIGGVTARNSPKGIVVSWTGIEYAKGYNIYRMNDGSDWELINTAEATATSFVDKNSSYGKKTLYAVSCFLTEGNDGPKSKSAEVYPVNPKKPMVALTYDDGPYRPSTNLILDALKRHGGRATFFVVGDRVATYADCVKREAELGCEVASHTYSHCILSSASASTIKSEISRSADTIKQYSGQDIRIVRAPGGAVNDTVSANVKYPLVNWSVDTLDWKHRDSSITTQNVLSYAKDGSIVLMHDLHQSSGNAAETIISSLTSKGFQLVTVSEMMDAKGISMQNGKLYYNGYSK